jgi:hypothetical protein
MMKSDLGLDRSRKGVGGDEPEHAGERLLRMPEVVLLLAVEPEVRCRAREPGQTGGHLGTDRGRAGQNAVERLTRDAKLPGGLADGEAKARQNPIPQDPAWMRRRRREDVSGGGHAGTLVKPTVALWATGRRKQGLPWI